MINGKYLSYEEFAENIKEDIQRMTMCWFQWMEAGFGHTEHPDDPDMRVDTFRLTGERKGVMYPEYNLWEWYQQYCYIDHGDIDRTGERLMRQYEREACVAEKQYLEARIAELDKQVPPKWVVELDTMLECLDNYKQEQQKALSFIKQQLENMGISLESEAIRAMGREEVMQYVKGSGYETTPVQKEEPEEAGYSLPENVADTDKETQQGEQETWYGNYEEPGRSR